MLVVAVSPYGTEYSDVAGHVLRSSLTGVNSVGRGLAGIKHYYHCYQHSDNSGI